jgi:hypothetical protein
VINLIVLKKYGTGLENKMSLKDEIQKSMAAARKNVAELRNAEERSRDKERDAEKRMFAPIKEALDLIANEFSGDSTIEFNTKDYLDSSYLIEIITKSERYEISIDCQAFPEEYGFRFSYILSFCDEYNDIEIFRKRFDEGKEKDLLDKLMFILASYEADGFISPLILD